MLEAKNGKWVEIGVTGRWKGHKQGEFELTEESFNEIIKNFKNKKSDIVVDYEHQTLEGAKAPASGWIKELKKENDKLYAKIKWTEKAKKMIKNREYRYLSPVFIKNTKDRESGENIGWTLHSIALTNTPFLEELKPIKNKGENLATDNREEELKKLKEQLAQKESEIEELKKELQKLKEDKAKSLVEGAVEKGLIEEEQKEWANKYALNDMEEFQEFLKNSKPKKIIEKPKDNIYTNKNGIDIKEDLNPSDYYSKV